MQRMGSLPILGINANVTSDTMLMYNANTDTNIDVDAQCERTFKKYLQNIYPRDWVHTSHNSCS